MDLPETVPLIPATVVLHKMPDGHASSGCALTVGKTYKVHGEMGSCLVIDTDEAGQRVSVHWSRFLPHNG